MEPGDETCKRGLMSMQSRPCRITALWLCGFPNEQDSAMTEPAAPAASTFSFGPFTVTPHERLVMRDGVALPMGARSFDTLMR